MLPPREQQLHNCRGNNVETERGEKRERESATTNLHSLQLRADTPGGEMSRDIFVLSLVHHSASASRGSFRGGYFTHEVNREHVVGAGKVDTATMRASQHRRRVHEGALGVAFLKVLCFLIAHHPFVQPPLPRARIARARIAAKTQEKKRKKNMRE
jgi:hypothetical protein